MYMNTLYINKRQGPLAVYADKQLYNQGDTVSVVVTNLNSTAAVSANITGPGLNTQVTLSASQNRYLTVQSAQPPPVWDLLCDLFCPNQWSG